MVMWKHLLLLGSLGCCLAALADSDKDATNTTPSEELSTNAADLGSVEEVIKTKDGSLGEVESAVISLQSMDFAGALQAHSLLMVPHISSLNNVIRNEDNIENHRMTRFAPMNSQPPGEILRPLVRTQCSN